MTTTRYWCPLCRRPVSGWWTHYPVRYGPWHPAGEPPFVARHAVTPIPGGDGPDPVGEYVTRAGGRYHTVEHEERRLGMGDTDGEVCVLCPDRGRVPYRPPVCGACRSWLPGIIADLRILVEELTTTPPVITDRRVVPVLDLAGREVPLWDPVIHAVPAAPIRGQRGGPRVFAAPPESTPPTSLDPIDLVLPARPGSLWAADPGDGTRVGGVSVATVLQAWARDWRTLRARGEGNPEPTVVVLTRWLSERADWACDDYPHLVDFAADVRFYRWELRRVLGRIDGPEYKRGVACPKCGLRALYRKPAGDWIECAGCPNILSPEEYTATVGAQAAVADPTRQPFG